MPSPSSRVRQPCAELQVAGTALHDAQIVVTGSGRVSVACVELLCALDIDSSQVLMVDDEGVLHAERHELPRPARQFAVRTSRRSLVDAVAGADVVVGLSATVTLTPDLVPLMAAVLCYWLFQSAMTIGHRWRRAFRRT